MFQLSTIPRVTARVLIYLLSKFAMFRLSTIPGAIVRVLIYLLSKFSAGTTSAEQENWSQNQYNLRALLCLSPNTVYTLKHLEDKETLTRRLRLLFHKRNSQKQAYVQIILYITYDKLPKAVVKTIAKKLMVEELQLRQYFLTLQPLWVFVVHTVLSWALISR